MTINDIKSLISDGETRTLELKKTTGELKDAMHTACAFLNTEGGWLVFGIAPTTLKILGQDVTDNTRQEIALALSGLEPAVEVKVEYIDVSDGSGHKVIAIHFDGFVFGNVPYTYHGCPYYKVESTTKIMPRDMFEERLKANRPQYYAWERQGADGLEIENLNEELIRGIVRLGIEKGRMSAMSMTEPIGKILEKWRLLDKGILNNAAAVLFTKKAYLYSQFTMRMARFRGIDKKEFIDNQRIEGNLFELLEAGMAFFFKHLSMNGKIVGLVREEHLEIPAEALREALINALCHRQYEKYNLTIGLAIYDDRIEIENPGQLPPQLTTESIKQPHFSYPYNPLIADVLFKTSFLENWGTGASRILDACRLQGVPEPVWRTQMGFVILTFRRSSFGLKNDAENGNLQLTCNQLVTNLTGQVKKLIINIGYSELSRKEVKLQVKLASDSNLVDNYLNPAIKQGLVTMLYPDSPRHPKQKYLLTEKGKIVYEILNEK